jgi:hypothetical protein
MQLGKGSPHRVQDVRLVQEPRRNRSLIVALVAIRERRILIPFAYVSSVLVNSEMP